MTHAPRLGLVLGDQLAPDGPALDGLDRDHDALLMIEAPGEAGHVWSHRARIAVFLSAMRHARDAWLADGWTVHYVALDADGEPPALLDRLARALARLRPQRLQLAQPGEWRLDQGIRAVARTAGVELRVMEDRHFLCTAAAFARLAGPPGRPLLMEAFYRRMRVELDLLLDDDRQPAGGRWNHDEQNRRSWPKRPSGRAGPGLIAPPMTFTPDATTREVLALVSSRFAEHPGSLADFAWPVTRTDALQALTVFVDSRLASFGPWQDAMWTATPFGWHSLLSCSLNLHLLDPREVVAAVQDAWRRGDVPIASAEGFVRQVVGWREFVRGVYWQDMPGLAAANHFEVHRPLPAWYWTGDTAMACAREAVGQTLRHGYAHHIQRLMVTGLFALLAEVEPRQVADWYLAVYVDAVEWVELPNVAGMALFADGGRFVSKPYIASGAYIDRMSDYCRHCRYAPTEAAAAQEAKPLCPFTVLYWNFVERRASMLDANPRTVHFTKPLRRKSPEEREALRREAARMLAEVDTL